MLPRKAKFNPARRDEASNLVIARHTIGAKIDRAVISTAFGQASQLWNQEGGIGSLTNRVDSSIIYKKACSNGYSDATLTQS